MIERSDTLRASVTSLRALCNDWAMPTDKKFPSLGRRKSKADDERGPAAPHTSVQPPRNLSTAFIHKM